MTTSASTNFSVTRDNLISLACQQVGLIGEGETPSANLVTEAALLLNMLVKTRMADGMPLWALKRGYLLPFPKSSSISIGGSVQAVSTYVTTTLATAAVSGATTISVSSATGIASTYAIGIWQDDNTVLWTTVNGAPSGTTITLTAALTDDAAAGNRVYVYVTTNRLRSEEHTSELQSH